MILADSRRMWRVFDNLMNNVCKYSQRETRVYLSLETEGEEAVITFKNTSARQLDISPDELMERFVRGDSSRNTEGNGLGLSIARSLTELQGGSFSLQVDGDLFKAILRFPVFFMNS
jgi:signal transduction histidine kinase